MSGSPSYAEIQLREAEERRLADERRRRAEEERRRREEAERRARIEAIRQLRATLGGEAAHLVANLTALRAALVANEVAGVAPITEAQITALLASAGDTAETISVALMTLRGWSRQVAHGAKVVSSHVQALTAERDALRREASAEAARLATVDAAESERHRQGIVRAIDLRARVAGIQADDVAMAWSHDVVHAVSAAIDALADAADPAAQAASLGHQLDGALVHAQERQLAEERRAYIVAALQDGLRDQGFQVGDAVVVGDGLQGEVAFRAVRADRRWVDVNVPVQGHVYYDVDGIDRITERGADGALYTSCDDTEARLGALHADLAERFGIEAGELLWEAKDPNRLQRNANELPSGGPAATRKQGG